MTFWLKALQAPLAGEERALHMFVVKGSATGAFPLSVGPGEPLTSALFVPPTVHPAQGCPLLVGIVDARLRLGGLVRSVQSSPSPMPLRHEPD